MQENFMEEVRGATNSPNNTQESRAERIVEKTESFMIQVLNDLNADFIKNGIIFSVLSSSDQNKYLNVFLEKKFPNTFSDYRKKIKIELLKSINHNTSAFF